MVLNDSTTENVLNKAVFTNRWSAEQGFQISEKYETKYIKYTR